MLYIAFAASECCLSVRYLLGTINRSNFGEQLN